MEQALTVFPDTNVFLHFPPLSQIDWLSICGAKTVHLVICLTVIHELDDKKSDSRLASRAERAIKEIRDAGKSQSMIRDGVTFAIFNKEIRKADFPETLSPESNDDKIVHLAKLFHAQNPGREVAIATGDYGMELRAEAGGVPVYCLDASLRLPNPHDEMTKKYQKAVTELNSIKNRLPKLNLGLAHSEATMQPPQDLVFELPQAWKPIDIEMEMNAIQEKHPKGPARSNQQDARLQTTAMLMRRNVSEDKWAKYNHELDKFYTEYRSFLEQKNLFDETRSRALEFDLWSLNNGTCLATNVDVILSFPNSICFVAERNTGEAKLLESVPEPPSAPTLPSPFDFSVIARSNYLQHLPIPRFHELSNLDLRQKDDWTPEIAVTRNDEGESEVHVRVSKLKHGHSVLLGQFVVVFGRRDEINTFEVNHVSSMSELADKIVGSIPIIVNKDLDRI